MSIDGSFSATILLWVGAIHFSMILAHQLPPYLSSDNSSTRLLPDLM